jgi:hypothetical protein
VVEVVGFVVAGAGFGLGVAVGVAVGVSDGVAVGVALGVALGVTAELGNGVVGDGVVSAVAGPTAAASERPAARMTAVKAARDFFITRVLLGGRICWVRARGTRW